MDDFDDSLYDFDPSPPFPDKNRSRMQLVGLIVFKIFLRFILPMSAVVVAVLLIINLGSKKTGCLLVTAEPDSALIVLNGSVILQNSGEIVDNLMPGGITVTVHKKGFAPEPQEFYGEIAAGETLKVHFILSPEQIPSAEEPVEAEESFFTEYGPEYEFPEGVIPAEERPSGKSPQPKSLASAIIVTSNVKGAEIWLNGENTGLVTNANLEKLAQGKYVVAVKREGFKADNDSLVIEIERDFQTEIAYFDLKPIYDKVNPTLTVETIPIQAPIYLNSEYAGEGEVHINLNFGEYTLSFGEVKNFHTPIDMVVQLTQRNPVQTVSVKYSRIMGNSAVALIYSAKEGLIEGEKFSFFLDGIEYYNPERRAVQGYLFDHIPAGKHDISFIYEGIKTTQEVETVDGQVVNISFIMERVFTKKKIKIQSISSIPRSNWMKTYASLNVQLIQMVD